MHAPVPSCRYNAPSLTQESMRKRDSSKVIGSARTGTQSEEKVSEWIEDGGMPEVVCGLVVEYGDVSRGCLGAGKYGCV